MFGNIKEIYQYRQMLKSLILTDLRTRYKGSFLGFLWTFINPLLMLLVYTIIFSTIMRINIPHYAMFMFVGLLPWIFFSSSIQNSAGIVIRQGGLVKKIYFPRLVLPLSTVGAALINYLLSLLIMIPALYITDMSLSWPALYFPLILLVQTILALGFSILVSSLNVFFRDLEHMLGILLMLMFYLTPVIYPVNMIPQEYRNWFELNPMKSITEAYQRIFYYGNSPDLVSLLNVAGIAVGVLMLSIVVFQQQQKRFAEEI